jgi:hypothetical protein
MQPSIAAQVFPLNLLTIALSWTGALARIGPISGPLLVGWMMLEGWSGTQILMAFTLVPLLSAGAFAIMALAATRRSKAARPQHGKEPQKPATS